MKLKTTNIIYVRSISGDTLISFTAGSSPNAVPARAEAKLSGLSVSALSSYISGLENAGDFELTASDDSITVTSAGKTAHSAFPEGSESAAVKLAAMLRSSGLLDERSYKDLEFIEKGFQGYYGEGMGVACEDDLNAMEVYIKVLPKLDKLV